MKTTHRFYSEEVGDFRRLCRFIIDHNDQIRLFSTWCLGRLVDWKYGPWENKTAVPDFCNQNAHLWFDGFQRLAGFVISEEGDAGFAIITLAGYRFLFEEMLQWALANWGEVRGPKRSLEITARQEMEAAVLERYGFKRKAEFYRQAFDLKQELAPRAPLVAGFSIVDMAALHRKQDWQILGTYGATHFTSTAPSVRESSPKPRGAGGGSPRTSLGKYEFSCADIR